MGADDRWPDQVKRETADEPPRQAPLKPDWLDFLALSIASLQVLWPVLAGIVGALFVIYLLLWLAAR